MPMGMPGQMGAGPAQSDQGQQGGGGIIETIDSGLGMLSNELSKLPGGEDLAKRMAKVKAEYMAIIQAAAQASQGGGNMMPTPQKSSPIPERSQGMPASPAGVY